MKATIVYIIDPDTQRVLLAKKRRKIGVGKWFGYGGKLEPQDNGDLDACIYRETLCETEGVIILDREKLERVALIHFYNGEEKIPGKDEPITVLCYRYFIPIREIPPTTDEMETPTLFPLNELPEQEMKMGDMLIVPNILAGIPRTGYIHFTKDESRVIDAQLSDCTEQFLKDFVA
ncbi:MAG TPA: NUDIX domain-containing protein [Candidatus Paceibacterota bacterium]|nr:NUDIX domain-containing protein [Candidatus Paceibacterota bacterium]